MIGASHKSLALALFLVLSAGGEIAPAFAQDNPDANAIVEALTPSRSLTRSLGRGVSVSGGDTSALPSIDMQVQFAYDSDALENEAILALEALRTALADPRLADFRFAIIGHTDAKGSASYNQALSERRAKAVVAYLVKVGEIDPGRLEASGKGESEPANKNDPEAAENRRVEIVNLGS